MAKVKMMVEDDLPIPRTGARRAFGRLLAWYAVTFALFGGVWWALSALPASPGSDPTDPLTGQGSLVSGIQMADRIGRSAVSWTAALLQMIAALLLVIPLAFVYVRTRTRTKYDHSLIQTVIVLPIGITAVLMMVRDSLALAFGLAGVVAAVRFRNNLKESGDAVYIFTSIVIGFAAGIQSLGIAALLSVLFCALEMAIWYWNIAEPSGQQMRRICLGESVETIKASPLERLAALAHVTPRARAVLQTPAGTHELVAVGAVQAPGSLDAADGAASDEREQRLHVVVSDLINAQASIADVLNDHVKRWTLLRRDLGEGSAGRLEYAVRLRKREGADALGDRLRDRTRGTIRTLEWRPAPPNGGNGA